MPSHIFHNVKIAAVSAAVPTQTIHNRDYADLIGQDAVEKFINLTGIESHQKSILKQTSGDLGYVAAEKLLTEKNIDRSQIGAIIDITEFPDYIAPSTAFVVHKRLGLSQSCMAFDVNLGCTGYVYGLHIGASLLQAMTQKYVLLVVGDSIKIPDIKGRKKPDNSSLMMYGDAGTATLLEKTDVYEDVIETDLYGDGTDFKMIYRLGRCRSMNEPADVTTWSDGSERSLYDPYMDGMGVFVFATSKVPEFVRSYLKERNETLEDYDAIYFHQPNKMILDRIAKTLKLPCEKVPMSLIRYGNTNCATIPLTLSDTLGNDIKEDEQKLMLCGFGIGMSWGIATVKLSPKDVFAVIRSDDYYEEGEVHPI